MAAPRSLFLLLPILLSAAACGNDANDGKDQPLPTVREVRAAGTGCEAAGTLTYVRTLEVNEPYTAPELALRGFDVSGDAMHLLYVSWAPGKCARIVRSLDLQAGTRREELTAPDACAFSEVPGEIAAIGDVHYVRSSGGKKDRLLQWDANGQKDIGALPPGLRHLGVDQEGRLVGSDAAGNLFALAPGSAAAPLATIALPPWGPSVGPEVDGERVWMMRHAFEGGMKNQIGFTSIAKPSTLCAFETERFPGLQGTAGQLFAVRADHVYIAAAAPSVDGVQKLVVVELVRQPGS